MFLLASASRRAYRERRMADRLSRLAAVATEPATARHGRIVTVVVRKPQATTESDRFDLLQYIHPWWTTLNKIGLRGTVLYSGVSPHQIAAATTRHVDFVEVHPGPRHIFHERHFLIRDFLKTIDDPCVFLTDASDVAFKRDPFPLVLDDRGRHSLFVGREKRRIAGAKCVRNEMRQQFGRVYFPFRPVLNPGILGGSREMVIRALDQVTALIGCLDGRLIGSDMCIVNRALYESFAPGEIFTGPPLHSRFKGWEFDTTAAILHK